METLINETFLLGWLFVVNLMFTVLGVSYIRFVRDVEDRYAALKRSSDKRDYELDQLKKDFGFK